MGFIKNVKNEIRVIRERDPAIHSDMEVFLYPSFKVMLHYRVAHKLYLKKHYFLARWVSQRGARKTGIEIHPGAKIGENFFIDHGNGVIIGETSEIGNNVTLYQGVTLGGTGKEHGKRHPTIGDNVMIGAGSVVIEEVPPNCTVVGVPGRIVKRDNKALVREELNQVDLPDPVSEDIKSLEHANSEIINQLLELEQQVRHMKRELEKMED
jgi:serine O-acetyltransferase